MAWAVVTRAPLAQRSEQACRVVSRPFSQGSLIKAGKPSTEVSTSSPCLLVPIACASSGLLTNSSLWQPLSACWRGWAGSLAAHPRQAMPWCPVFFGSDRIAACGRKRLMKRWSSCCFQRHSQGWGPRHLDPQSNQAYWRVPLLRPSSCIARL